MHVPFSHFPQSTTNIWFWWVSALHWSNVSFPHTFFSRHLTGQVRKQDFSNTKKTDPSHSLCRIFFSTLVYQGAQYCFTLVQVITNSIKVTKKYIFTHDCLISGPYKRQLRFEWSDFFVSVILDEVLMCVLSHRVGQLRLLCVMQLVCLVMMNGCLVCWFYGVLVVRFTRGRRARVGRELKGGGKPRWCTVTGGHTLCQSSCPSEDMREP